MLLPPPRVVAYGLKAAMASNVYMLSGPSKSANEHKVNRPIRFLTTRDYCTAVVISQLSAPQIPSELDIHQLSQLSPPSPILLQTPPPVLDSKERVVLLITCPLDAVMTGIFSTLGVDMERKTPALEKWNQASPPRVTENLRFAIHMSIFIVDAKIWNDKSISFKEKFKAGRFWDHQGPRGIRRRPKQGTAGIPWSDYDISTIEAVEQLGTSTLSDAEIREKGSSDLLKLLHSRLLILV
jgi:hypothetical protein